MNFENIENEAVEKAHKLVTKAISDLNLTSTWHKVVLVELASKLYDSHMELFIKKLKLIKESDETTPST